MPDISQQDMSFQPAAKGYSFSANPTQPSSPQSGPKKQLNPLVLLVFEIFGLITVFIVFLLVLNYFRIISLSAFLPSNLVHLPQATQPAAPTYDSKLGFWTIKGTFYGYNQYVIKIKINNQITNFQWSDGNSNAVLYNSEKDLSIPKSPTVYGLYDLEQNQNIGRKVTVQYNINNKENAIVNLSIFKL